MLCSHRSPGRRRGVLEKCLDGKKVVRIEEELNETGKTELLYLKR